MGSYMGLPVSLSRTDKKPFFLTFQLLCLVVDANLNTDDVTDIFFLPKTSNAELR